MKKYKVTINLGGTNRTLTIPAPNMVKAFEKFRADYAAELNTSLAEAELYFLAKGFFIHITEERN